MFLQKADEKKHEGEQTSKNGYTDFDCPTSVGLLKQGLKTAETAEQNK